MSKTLLQLQMAKADNTDHIIVTQHYPSYTYVVERGGLEQAILEIFQKMEEEQKIGVNQLSGGLAAATHPLDYYAKEKAAKAQGY